MSPGRSAASSSEVPATWPNHGRFRLYLVRAGQSLKCEGKPTRRDLSDAIGCLHGALPIPLSVVQVPSHYQLFKRTVPTCIGV